MNNERYYTCKSTEDCAATFGQAWKPLLAGYTRDMATRQLVNFSYNLFSSKISSGFSPRFVRLVKDGIGYSIGR